MDRKSGGIRWAVLAGAALLGGPRAGVPADPAPRACDEWLLPPREAKGHKVGPGSCRMLETDVSLDGRSFQRLDVGLDGKVDGYVTEGTGAYRDYLTNAPGLQFPQTSDPGPILHAVASYERDKGAAMVLVYPKDGATWNGKLWVTAHGRGRSFKRGNLRGWDKNLDPANPARDLNKYDRLMLAKGYALVKTQRTSEQGIGEVESVLEDGRKSMDKAFNDTHQYVIDFAAVAERAIERRLGRAPARTYFYGHSAGARIGRGLNYTPGLNVSRDGKPAFDGILADDSAAGTWLPIVLKDGKDVLFAGERERAAFVPQLEVSHQMYNNEWPNPKPDWMSSSYLENKRRNARALRDKGLQAKHRMYEVRGISHSGGESLAEGSAGPIQILDLSRMMDRFIDMLDAWVEKGVAPPATRSDWAELGDADRDGVIENPALAFPEVACPLGVNFPYPPGNAEGVGTTSFAAFTGKGLEPRDGRGVFVDMNRNGVWDYRETPAQAWRRLLLLKESETFTREKYVSCIETVAERLRRDGFFSEQTTRSYAEQARTAELQPKSP